MRFKRFAYSLSYDIKTSLVLVFIFSLDRRLMNPFKSLITALEVRCDLFCVSGSVFFPREKESSPVHL